MTEAGAGTPQIVRGEVLDLGAQGSGLDDVPNGFGRDSCAPDLTESVYAPKDPACSNSGSLSPFVDSLLRPGGDRNRADALAFTDQIGNNAMLLPSLEVLRPKANKFGLAMSASVR